MSEKKVRFGLSNVHIAKITETDGEVGYATPFAMPGAVNLSADAEGETSTFFADNKTYFKVNSNNGYTGSLEIADVPDEFLTDILGQVKDNNGAVIENFENKEARFALMCEIDGDPKKRRIVFYDCIATRPSLEYSTKEESVEVKTVTMDLTMTPRSSDGQIKATIEPTEENQAVYDTFFTKVYEKDATASV